jgi:ketosteroid isomerase-like protein
MNLTYIRVILLLAFIAIAGCDRQESTGAEQVRNEVRAVIESQQAAWNRGDIDGFMNGYDRAETTIFVSGDEVTHGWQTVLDRYKKRYSSSDLMGTLAFSDIDIQPLSPDHVLVDGRWKLTRANDAPFGRFTLLFRRTNSGWRIVHDTTTSANP